MILMKYHGAIYRFETLATPKFDAYTKAKSKEKAISQIKSKAKTSLGYVNSAKVDLVGTLTIYYDKEHRDVYNINRDDVTLVETDIPEITKAEKGYSLEETKYMYVYPEESEQRWILTHENGYKEDVTRKISIYGSTITYEEDEFFFDEESGVYWKDGIPYNSRIEKTT